MSVVCLCFVSAALVGKVWTSLDDGISPGLNHTIVHGPVLVPVMVLIG